MRRRNPAAARYPVCRVLLVLVSLLLLPSCWLSQNKLQTVKATGELVGLTRVSPTTYYESPEGLAGFEYDLIKAFADHLGVRLRLIVVDRSADILPRLANGEADIAAAGLTVTEGFRWQVKFTPPIRIFANRWCIAWVLRVRPAFRISSAARSKCTPAPAMPNVWRH